MFLASLETYQTNQTDENKQKAQTILNSVYSLIDKGTKKKVFHKNTAARKKSKLALQLKAI
jgi:ribosomal protein S20